MTAATSDPPAHRIENHAAGRPRRRSGATTASTRNEEGPAEQCDEGVEAASVIIP